jgi:hypothetical protein
MSPAEIAMIVALTAYAAYRQSIRRAVVGKTRFKLAAIYAVVGVVAGGYYVPPDAVSWSALAFSLVASLLVGLARGRLTALEVGAEGQVFCQGTWLTLSLFFLLIGAKFAWGTWQYLHHQHPHGGFGEVLLLIAAMIAVQAEIVWRRAQALKGGLASPSNSLC